MRRSGRFLRGGAEIRVTGAEPWRFPDRCAAGGILLEDVTAEDPFTLRAVILWRDLPAGEKIAASCGCEWQVISRHGAPKLWRRLRRRWFFAATGILLSAGLAVSSLFVWDVRVTENDSPIPDGVILRTLEEEGVKRGAFYPGFRADLIRSRALSALPELSWLAVNVRGGRAGVEVRAAVAPPEIWDPRQAADVTAARGGVVMDLTVLEGTPLVKRGDAVEPGQVLISADRPGRSIPVHARGEVTARTRYELTARAPLATGQITPNGEEKRQFALILGRRRINFYGDSGILPPGYVKITKIWAPDPSALFPLPLAWVTERVQSVRSQEAPQDENAVREAVEERLLSRLRETLGERGEIHAARFSVAWDGEWITVTLRAECSERIDTDTPR